MCPANPPFSWEELYAAAILELDPSRILPRILAAKTAICDRVEELNGEGNLSERVALNRALKALCVLQTRYARSSPAESSETIASEAPTPFKRESA